VRSGTVQAFESAVIYSVSRPGIALADKHRAAGRHRQATHFNLSPDFFLGVRPSVKPHWCSRKRARRWRRRHRGYHASDWSRNALASNLYMQAGHMISRPTWGAILASCCAVLMMAAASIANAASKFDGIWSVVLSTSSGPCSPTYKQRGEIINGIMHFSGAASNNFSGRVTPSGYVSVKVSAGGSWGIGSGHLSTYSGSGIWRAHMENGVCSGTWSAQRG
jgi:hypothetical protein